MFKNLITTIVTILIISSISGCSSHSLKVSRGVKLSDGPIIAYAYMKDGKTLLRVQKSYTNPKEGEEVILIKKDGFYPNYELNNLEENGKTYACPLPYSKKDTRDMTDKCHSSYSEHSVGHILAITGLLVIARPADLRSFDKEYFFEVIEKNNLTREQ